MLVRDVMSSPVVTVAPGAHLKEVADLLVRHEISAVPVVDGDEDIAGELRALLEEELGPPSPYRVAVRDGVVELTGPPDPTARRLATLLVRGVPGVVDVRFAEE